MQHFCFVGFLLLAHLCISSMIDCAQISVNTNEDRQRLEGQRQNVQRQIELDRQNLQNCQGAAYQTAQQSLEADQRQLQLIKSQLQGGQSFQEAENQNQQAFGGGRRK